MLLLTLAGFGLLAALGMPGLKAQPRRLRVAFWVVLGCGLMLTLMLLWDWTFLPTMWLDQLFGPVSDLLGIE